MFGDTLETIRDEDKYPVFSSDALNSHEEIKAAYDEGFRPKDIALLVAASRNFAQMAKFIHLQRISVKR